MISKFSWLLIAVCFAGSIGAFNCWVSLMHMNLTKRERVEKYTGIFAWFMLLAFTVLNIVLEGI